MKYCSGIQEFSFKTDFRKGRRQGRVVMAYQVIARKWRPQRFSDMVGQEHIARTLKNAVISGRIAHAYLFVGPRGIGKTTSARIFAKAINCVHPIDGEPCCQCSSCKAIAEESSVDVIEIDAATHTQVDKAREICEDVLHLPIASKYKIYIIDEVHMLSKSAWNALLKTIEEPPAHAKFIFATTEVNKVLPTVISRCQRFDLRRIPSAAIAGRLRYIADAEKVNISDSAINVIAYAADGGMRDAQSLMDQLISFFGTDSSDGISEAQALSLFGLTAPTEMKALMKAVISNDRESAVVSIHKLAEQGKNLETLYEEMTAWLRGILLCRILRTPQAVLEESPEKIRVYNELAAEANPGVVQRLLESLSASGYLLREAINKQVFLESVLFKAMRLAHSVQIEDLIARLNQIRKNGELDALNSVVPLYELPPGEKVVRGGSGIAAVRSGDLPSAGADLPRHGEQLSPEEAEKKTPDALPQELKQESSSGKTLVHAEVPPVFCASPEILSETPSPSGSVSSPSTSPIITATGSSSSQEAALSTEKNRETAAGDKAEKAEEEKAGDKAEPPLPQQPPPPPNEPLNIPGNDPEDKAEPDADDDTPDDALEDMPDDADGNRTPGHHHTGRAEKGSSLTPELLWGELILDISDNLKKTTLASFMEDGHPESFRDSVLSVAYDIEYGEMQRLMVEKDLNMLISRLRAVSGDSAAVIQLKRRFGIATPAQVEQKISVDELKKQAAADPFVRQALELFSGRLADAYAASPPEGASRENQKESDSVSLSRK